MSRYSHTLTTVGQFISICSMVALAATPVAARQNLMRSSQNGSAMQNSSTLYKQKNFSGDERGGDLYRCDRQPARSSWDTYKKSLQQANSTAKSNAAGVRRNPPPNGAAGLMTGYNLGGAGSATALPSVRGTVLNSSVPGISSGMRPNAGCPPGSHPITPKNDNGSQQATANTSIMGTVTPGTATVGSAATSPEADTGESGYTPLSGNYEPSGNGAILPVPGLVDERYVATPGLTE